MYFEITAEATIYYSITVKADSLEEALIIAKNEATDEDFNQETADQRNWEGERVEKPYCPAFNEEFKDFQEDADDYQDDDDEEENDD